MANRITSTSQRQPRIISTSETYPRIDPAEVARALGAEDTGVRIGKPAGSPPAQLGLRQELHRRLRSTGGRRALEGAGVRRKIPLIEGDWERLQQVAEASEMEGVRPTPAQVASILLHQVLQGDQSDLAARTARPRKR